MKDINQRLAVYKRIKTYIRKAIHLDRGLDVFFCTLISHILKAGDIEDYEELMCFKPKNVTSSHWQSWVHWHDYKLRLEIIEAAIKMCKVKIQVEKAHTELHK